MEFDEILLVVNCWEKKKESCFTIGSIIDNLQINNKAAFVFLRT